MKRASAFLLLVLSVVAVGPPIASAAVVLRVPQDYSTIQAAIDAASDGDTVLVAPGEYQEYVTFLGKAVVVRSAVGSAATTIVAPPGTSEAEVVELSGGGELNGFSIASRSQVIYRGVFIPEDGGRIVGNRFTPGTGRLRSAVYASDVSVTILDNVFEDFCDSRSVVEIDGVSLVDIRNNLFAGTCDAIELDRPEAGSRIVNNTFVDVGIAMDTLGTSLAIRNNIVASSYLAVSARGDNASFEALTNNLVWDNQLDYGGITDPTGSDGNLRANPMFTGSLPHPYSPVAASPAVDAGTDVDAPPNAIDGAPRPIDGDGDMTATVDIGAYEVGWDRAIVSAAVKNTDGRGLDNMCAIFSTGATAVASVRSSGGEFAASLDAATYLVEVTDCGAGVYEPEWYDDAADSGSATPVVVTLGQTEVLSPIVLEPAITCGGLGPTMWGSNGADVLLGTDQADVIVGRGLGDYIEGNGGSDVICGGPGNDSLQGGDGDDVAFGGAGNDGFSAWGGADVLKGGPGDDYFAYVEGAHEFNGGDGRDRIDYSVSNVPAGVDVDLEAGTAVNPDGSNDTLVSIEDVTGTDLSDRVIGSSAANEINLRGGSDDYVDGGAGPDVLYSVLGVVKGGPGNDTLEGRVVLPGPGNDQVDAVTVSYAESSNGVWVNLNKQKARGEGKDTVLAVNVIGSPYADTIVGQPNTEFLRGGAGDDIIRGAKRSETIYGGPGNDTIDTRDYPGIVFGGGGDDHITASGWDDEVHGGAGDDTILGGDGSDDLRGGDGADVLEGGAGRDKLRGNNGRDDLSGGADGDFLFGGNADDVLRGGDGRDRLNGASGRDLLVGGLKNDLLIGGEGADRLEGGAGNDVLDGSEGNDKLFGEGRHDLLIGGSGDDRLDGGPGNDTLAGLDGDDVLLGSSGTDTASFALSPTGVEANLNTGVAVGEGSDSLLSIEWLVGSPADDILIGNTGANLVEGRAGDDVVLAGSGDDLIAGFDGNDELSGESGDDYIEGNGGTDSIDGGAGSDTCTSGESYVSCEEILPDVMQRGSTVYRWIVPYAVLLQLAAL